MTTATKLAALALAALAFSSVTQPASGAQGCREVALGGPDTAARTGDNRGVWKAPAGTDAKVKSQNPTHTCAATAADAQKATGPKRTTEVVKHPEGGGPSSINDNEYAYIPVRRFGTIAAPSGGSAGAPKTYAGVRMQQGRVESENPQPASGGGRLEVEQSTGLPADAHDWKYVPVHRVELFIEESLYRGTKWVNSEPNDERLCAKVTSRVGDYMMSLYRKGAFQGASAKDAFFVKCDRDDSKRGVTIHVGFAPLRPAEFTIIKITQMAGQIQTRR